MTTPKEQAAFEEWKAEITSRLQSKPKALENFNSLLQEGGDGEALELFKGHLREKTLYQWKSELDQDKAAFQTNKQAWQDWHKKATAEYKALVAERDRLAAQLAAGGFNDDDDENKVKLPPDVLRKQDLEEIRAQVQSVDTGSVAYSNALIDILSLAQEEGYKVNPRKILEQALSEKRDPLLVYQEITAEERKKREVAALEKLKKDEYERGVRETQSRLQTPDGLRQVTPESPTLAALQQAPGKVKTAQERRAAALATYLEKPIA